VDYVLNIEVLRIFLLTWLRENNDYRACQVKLAFTVTPKAAPVFSKAVEGTAKLSGANTRPVSHEQKLFTDRFTLEYYDEGPNIMKLAVADAVARLLNETKASWPAAGTGQIISSHSR
jgi:hypothetical protein